MNAPRPRHDLAPARSPLRSINPPSQNTAPVHEFACLYTHDLRRRKQKRWHDGILKFHTFNRRAMVYDQSRNHVGDTYWKEGNQLQEGDELTLENGVIVEVAESKSTTQTDLTPILQKRPRDPAPGAFSSGAVSQPPNRPLSAVLGTPKGPLGKARLPIRSPYEERQSNVWAARERARKRQKVAEVGQAWHAPKGRPPPPQRTNAPEAGRKAMAPPPIISQNIIDLTSEVEDRDPTSSDVTIPNTPPTTGISHPALLASSRRKNASNGRPPSPPRKTLKLRAGPQKKMLFCQEPAAAQQVPPKTAPREDVGPWSTEAMYLFDWRPPGYVKGFAAAGGGI